ncbi:NACHT domain-containing protein [uncultured Microbacterium sp.]|uniref:NACHT domain-containing protein n=1 Tax=uncultured Microbacterium sp. TaxID=191216 RepID=UPI0028E42A5C|nr:NACHT domain-containing protein [uncultured Microbacterium sp.]
MSVDPTPEVRVHSWVEDAALLIEKPGARWSDDRPLAAMIARRFLRDGASTSRELRDHVIWHALEHAAAAEGVRDRDSEALREIIRGMYWFPRSGDDYDGHHFEPTGADAALVTNGGHWKPAEVGQRRRWGMLRYWAARGERDAHSSPADALNAANRLKRRTAERLIADLDAFFASEDAREQFAPSIDRDEVHERFLTSRRTSLSLHRRLSMVAASLARLSPLYPAHLTVEDLVTDRFVVRFSQPDDEPTEEIAERVAAEIMPNELPVPAMQTLAASRRGVLLGDPGSGKSTLVRALVIEEVSSPRNGIAVYVRATSLTRGLREPSGSWLDVVARTALSLRLDPPSADDVQELSRLLRTETNSLLVVDGIDEVYDPSDRSILNDLIDALSALPGRVLMTSRLTGFRYLHGWVEFGAMSLGEAAFDTLVRRWYGESRYVEVWQAIGSTFGWKEHIGFVQHPVLAGIIANLCGQPSTDLAANRPALYRQAIAHLCQRLWKSPEQDERSESQVVALIAAYEEAAWNMVATSTVTSYVELVEAGVDAELVRTGELLQPSALDSDAVVDQPWTWIHSSFADYLVALRLHRLIKSAPAEATRALQEAIQHAEGWIESLTFLIEMVTPRQRAWIARTWAAFAREGDPGGVIEANATRLISEYQSGAGQAPSRNADDMLRELVADAEREAEIAEKSRPSAQAHLERILAGDNETALLRRPILTAEDAADRKVVSAYWAAFQSRPYPDNVPIAYAMGPAFFSREQPDPTDDARLATWFAASRLYGDASERVTPHRCANELAEEVLDGRFGDWGALSMAMREPAAVRASHPSIHAQLGKLLADGPLEPPFPLDPVAIREILDDFEVRDIHDPVRSERIVRVVRSIDSSSDKSLIEALVVLSNKLGAQHPWRRFELAATNHADLARLVQGAITRHIESFERFHLFAAAVSLHRSGITIRPSAISYSAEYRANYDIPSSHSDVLDALGWLIATEPNMIYYFDAFIPYAEDERVAEAVIEQLGSRIRAVPRVPGELARTLAGAGVLAEWRDRLLAMRA